MSILDEIIERVDGHAYEHYIAANCIFHNDTSPSLMIYEDSYTCLACGKHGSTKSLLKRLKGTTVIYQPAWEDEEEMDLINPFYRWLKKYTLKETMKRGWDLLNSFPHMGSYLSTERKINNELRKVAGIGYLDGFYTFPIRDLQGQIVGGFVRCPPGAKRRYFVPKGQDPNLLYIPRPSFVQKQQVVFLTFGGIDALSITQLGFAGISTTNGKRIDPAALDDIRKRIVLLPDYGEEVEARYIAQDLGWRGSVHYLNYPEGCKDPNDYGRANIQQLKSELEDVVRLNT